MAENGVTEVQKVQTQYQTLPHDEEVLNINPIQHGYQPITSSLQSTSTACADITGVQQNANSCSIPIQPTPPIGDAPITHIEPTCKISHQSTEGIDHQDQLKNSAMHKLVRHGVLLNQLAQDQCQTPTVSQEIVSHLSNQISIEPIPLCTQKANSADINPQDAQQNIESNSGVQKGDHSIGSASHNPQEVARQKTLQELIQKTNDQTLPSSHGQHFEQAPISEQSGQEHRETNPSQAQHSMSTQQIQSQSAPGTSSASMLVNHDDHTNAQAPQVPKNTPPAPLKVSSNFDRPTNPKRNQRNNTKPPAPPAQPIYPINPTDTNP